jgi:hypothetical protein
MKQQEQACPADNVSTPVYSKTSPEPTALRADVNGKILADVHDMGVALFALMLHPEAPSFGGFMSWEVAEAEKAFHCALDAVKQRKLQKGGAR